MKFLKLICITLLLNFSAFAQNGSDTVKYISSPDYGNKFKRVKVQRAFIPPTDTVFNKFGFAVLNGASYIGNGTSWSLSSGGGGSNTKFGVSGQDDAATSNRAFNWGDYTFTQSFTKAGDGNYILGHNQSSNGGYAYNIFAQHINGSSNPLYFFAVGSEVVSEETGQTQYGVFMDGGNNFGVHKNLRVTTDGILLGGFSTFGGGQKYALKVTGNDGNVLSFPEVTNATTQDRIIGQSSTTKNIDYITVGANLDLTNGVLSATGGSMVYPGAGIPLSTGTGWGTSITDNSTNWNTAYTDRNKWDGGATGLVPGTGRTSLGATTVGGNLFTLANPSAVTWPRINADNTVTTRSAAQTFSDLGINLNSVTTAGNTTGNEIHAFSIFGNGDNNALRDDGSIQGTALLLTGGGGHSCTISNPNPSGGVVNMYMPILPTGNFTAVKSVNGIDAGTNGDVTVGTVDNANYIAVTNDNTYALPVYPLWSNATGGTQPAKASNSKLTFVPSTGTLTTTTFVGALTGNASTATALAIGRTISGTGDATFTTGSFDGIGNVSGAVTVSRINGTSLAGLSTGILKNTTGTGVPSIAVAGDFPTLNQNTTGSAGSVANALSIGAEFSGIGATTYNGSAARTLALQNNAVTLAHMAQINTASFLGRTTAGTGNVENLTATQATALLNTFGASTKGLVPAASASPSSTKYLSEDGTFTTPAGGSATTTTDNLFQISSNVLTARKTKLSLTDGATITWDASTGYTAAVTLGGNRTLSITNPQGGDFYTIVVTQDATGFRTLTLPGGSLAKLNLKASEITTLSAYYDGTNYTWRSDATDPYYVALTSTYTLTSTTSTQKLFNATTNGAVTVQASTLYYFECEFALTSMSATSGNCKFDILGGGTATVTSTAWTSYGVDNTTPTAVATASGLRSTTTISGSNIVAAATGTGMWARVSGTIRINAGGTLIPSVALTTAAAAVVSTDSWFKITPLGGTATTGGPWN